MRIANKFVVRGVTVASLLLLAQFAVKTTTSTSSTHDATSGRSISRHRHRKSDDGTAGGTVVTTAASSVPPSSPASSNPSTPGSSTPPSTAPPVASSTATTPATQPPAQGTPPTTVAAASPTGSCKFMKADQPAKVALCETFDNASAKDPATRSGDLNAALWGVSRIGSYKDNTFYAATLTGCGAAQKVLPPNDVRICNGRLFDVSNDKSPSDEGGQIGLAMYPKQPFDISGGRTGTVVFDVSADAQSVHAAWPEFWWTDQPVPAPHGHLTTATPYARNSFGFVMAQQCGNNGTTISAMQVTRNYGFADIPFTVTGCVTKGSATGQLNHFEVRINQNRVEVWATNPGSNDIQMLAYADNANITMTKGLIWIEDVHYNACKFDTQCDHQLGWDNVGFDGPTPYRDLSFDVPDNKTTNPDGVQLGYTAGPTPLSVKTVPVYRQQTPTSALVTLNWWPYNQFVPSIRINGGPWHDTAWPFDSETFTWRTIAITVPVSETIDGPNTIEIKAGENVLVANINLILVAAAPVP